MCCSTEGKRIVLRTEQSKIFERNTEERRRRKECSEYDKGEIVILKEEEGERNYEKKKGITEKYD